VVERDDDERAVRKCSAIRGMRCGAEDEPRRGRGPARSARMRRAWRQQMAETLRERAREGEKARARRRRRARRAMGVARGDERRSAGWRGARHSGGARWTARSGRRGGQLSAAQRCEERRTPRPLAAPLPGAERVIAEAGAAPRGTQAAQRQAQSTQRLLATLLPLCCAGTRRTVRPPVLPPCPFPFPLRRHRRLLSLHAGPLQPRTLPARPHRAPHSKIFESRRVLRLLLLDDPPPGRKRGRGAASGPEARPFAPAGHIRQRPQAQARARPVLPGTHTPALAPHTRAYRPWRRR
jgi:hypothetical protein